MLPASRQRIDLGRLGGATDLVLATLLTAFLFWATESSGDAVPRPLVLGVLYATPGLVGLLGAMAGRRSLLIGAAVPLVFGSILSWSGVTLLFLIPALLFIAAAASTTGRTQQPGTPTLAAFAEATLVALLVLAAAVAVLFAFTVEGCHTIPGGTSCGSGLISLQGVAVAGALLVATLVVAVVRTRGPAEPG